MTTAKKTTRTRSTSTRKKSTSTRKTATKPRTVTVKKKELPPNPMVHELLEAVDSERVKAKKLELLRTHGDDSFKMVMIWNFDESVISVLPEGDVPYQPVEGDVQASKEQGVPQRTTIRNAARQFYRFVKGGDDQLNKIKRESIFINILQTLPQPEAEILVLVKDKALNTKYNITKELVSEAYPEITWGNRS
ncbi:hypothetical protein CYVG_00174 [Cyanophage S-SSM6a]|uniref:Uncharacterized protein n=1 Tax=Synechococcus phage S-SSM7 TaxID=445686 RepID=E3SLM7_9CAUD|nr:hypothetical protein SSSM7_314 [Synechococcus phage S-SSM7]ADO98375.1 hypothetical protein SSSM7_314 [Synechococcus phage S-SSM7]AGH07617.1 hypothetical protein CYVG_00174 [Cyanophage S-SSM6a]